MAAFVGRLTVIHGRRNKNAAEKELPFASNVLDLYRKLYSIVSESDVLSERSGLILFRKQTDHKDSMTYVKP